MLASHEQLLEAILATLALSATLATVTVSACAPAKFIDIGSRRVHAGSFMVVSRHLASKGRGYKAACSFSLHGIPNNDNTSVTVSNTSL